MVPDIYVVNQGSKAELDALLVARNLRKNNCSVELDHSGASFAKQFKRASRSGANWVAVIGEREAENCQISIKSLKSNKHDSKEAIFGTGDIIKIIEHIS